jgi:hypothetical protein
VTKIKDYEKVGDEIYHLREQKQNVQLESKSGVTVDVEK